MTRTISLITATVGAALLFAVPAWGDNWGADQAQPSRQTAVRAPGSRSIARSRRSRTGSSSDARRTRAVARRRRRERQGEPLDARERALAHEDDVRELVTRRRRVRQRAAAATRDTAPVVDDRFRIDPTSGHEPVTRELGPRDRVAADRHRARHRARAGTRALPGDALHAEPPARALIWVIETRWRPRPPRKRAVSVCATVYFEAWQANRGRTARASGDGGSTRSSGRSRSSGSPAAHACPHRSREGERATLVDAGLHRAGRRRAVARRAVRRAELGEERARGRLGRAAAWPPARAARRRRGRGGRRPSPFCASTTAAFA